MEESGLLAEVRRKSSPKIESNRLGRRVINDYISITINFGVIVRTPVTSPQRTEGGCF
jgi:hypothetical protein